VLDSTTTPVTFAIPSGLVGNRDYKDHHTAAYEDREDQTQRGLRAQHILGSVGLGSAVTSAAVEIARPAVNPQISGPDSQADQTGAKFQCARRLTLRAHDRNKREVHHL
jgi:hypothetical protein